MEYSASLRIARKRLLKVAVRENKMCELPAHLLHFGAHFLTQMNSLRCLVSSDGCAI